jgi:hypothetical protein
MTVSVEVIRDGAFTLLADMEDLDLIRIYSPSKNNSIEKKKLSEQFAGTLHLTDAGYEIYQNTLREGRNEWTRDIY